jgi:hypothetical protein
MHDAQLHFLARWPLDKLASAGKLSSRRHPEKAGFWGERGIRPHRHLHHRDLHNRAVQPPQCSAWNFFVTVQHEFQNCSISLVRSTWNTRLFRSQCTAAGGASRSRLLLRFLHMPSLSKAQVFPTITILVLRNTAAATSTQTTSPCWLRIANDSTFVRLPAVRCTWGNAICCNSVDIFPPLGDPWT